ncbi:MAG: HAMP domain-containing histidine kinase [Caldilineaceae bacterium]|nr:HAMP domain-containing histidine kinase [Caldilineaceae bacterium]
MPWQPGRRQGPVPRPWHGQPNHGRGHRAEWHGRPPWVGPPREQLRAKRRALLLRFLTIFGLLVLLTTGGTTLLFHLLTRWFGNDGHTPLFFWVGSCGLAFGLPLLGIVLAMRAFGRFATPLVNVMTAADAVAAGDLSVRVPAGGNGEVRRLTYAFNQMVTELERNDQQRRNLTADVAHELRTPLHIIQGNLEGVLDGVYEPTPEHINATLEETRHLARLVDDLRTLSLAESGHLPLLRTQVAVQDLLTDVLVSFGAQAEAKGVTLRMAPTAQPMGHDSAATNVPLLIDADAGRLNQVLSNLVMNALRHTADGGEIILSAVPQGAAVSIQVHDTGEGIAAEDLPFLFDRFWRGDRARTHTEGVGSGLGLAIARQLIQAHGGQIAVASEIGQGTTFTITLPLAGGQ